jgi:glycosyltransferase involved in cell wall biosynthesis
MPSGARDPNCNGFVKLVYLINSLGAGGAERSLAELLPYYGAAGIDTTVVCLRERKIGVESDVRLLGCRLVFLGGSGHARWIHSFRRLLSGERPALVHTTLLDSHLVGRLGAAGTGIPVLSSLVNTPYGPLRASDPHLNRFGFRMVRAVDGWTARHLTTHFHAITRAVRDAYVEALGIDASRVTVIERGRDTVRLGRPGAERRRRVRESLGLTAEHEVLINVGRQEYQKGQLHLLEAMARLVERRPNLILLVAGREGNLTPDLRRLHGELRLGDRVRFLGHRGDVPDILAASDVFVFPSHFEGLGGALIEAMALGLPVIASDIPALREVVEGGGSGELVPTADPAALATSIDALLAAPERRAAYGRRGRELFHERFEIGRSAGRMIEMYGSLTGAVRHSTMRPPAAAPA